MVGVTSKTSEIFVKFVEEEGEEGEEKKKEKLGGEEDGFGGFYKKNCFEKKGREEVESANATPFIGGRRYCMKCKKVY